MSFRHPTTWYGRMWYRVVLLAATPLMVVLLPAAVLLEYFRQEYLDDLRTAYCWDIWAAFKRGSAG